MGRKLGKDRYKNHEYFMRISQEHLIPVGCALQSQINSDSEATVAQSGIAQMTDDSCGRGMGGGAQLKVEPGSQYFKENARHYHIHYRHLVLQWRLLMKKTKETKERANVPIFGCFRRRQMRASRSSFWRSARTQ